LIYFCTFAVVMRYLGEIISIGVACSWTVTAIVSEIGSRQMGVLNFNTWRLAAALVFSVFLSLVLTGHFLPVYAGPTTWAWMSLSGVVGYFFGDFCLFKSYIYISSRYGQLFMTLAPAAAALVAWLVLGQSLRTGNVIAMVITLSGIAIAVLSKEEGHRRIKVNMPWKGVLYGIGAGLGQGLGLVLSKIGMDYYEHDIPAEVLGSMRNAIPFEANLIRCMAGFVCFFITVMIRRGGVQLYENIGNKTAVRSVFTAVIFGPFLGVGFSLMALQFTYVGIAQTLMSLTPIIILLPSYWIFKQPITLKAVVGACVSVFGASLFFLL
jgi:drug/metabolite transporter (DMT)-like permease